MPPWETLRAALARLGGGSLHALGNGAAEGIHGVAPAEVPDPATGERRAAALALLAETQNDLVVTYTRRRDDLRHHPGQVSFPGGRIDSGETPVTAAVREAQEEVGLDPATIEVLGELPPFFIPPSGFWLHAVVARWHRPHALVPAEAEVAEVFSVPFSELRDAASWRVVRLASVGHTWAWQLDERHLLWGATAIVTAVLLGLVDPLWHGGVEPAGLAADREVSPWEAPHDSPGRRS